MVVVAMSGGVDSSVAAALLLKKGYEVIGITMCFNLPDSPCGEPRCCGASAIADARRVSSLLGIRHYVLNLSREMERDVIADFIREYQNGRTPNPCVRCNEFVKFGALLKKAMALGADYLATGHYARIIKNGSYHLLKARDKRKDQSYFLYRFNQDRLRRILFPLGGYTKDAVKKLAKRMKFGVSEKKESQEICFIPRDYRSFLKARIRSSLFRPGRILDDKGNVIGTHQGVGFYTIGQREGLGLSCGCPVYVSRIDTTENAIHVSKRQGMYRRRFMVKNLVFPSGALKRKTRLRVKVRYFTPEVSADVEPLEDKAEVSLREAVFAITPGQSAVFYDKERVAGGGVIEEVLD